MKSLSSYRCFGYSCLGPLLLGYSKWLLENFKNEKLDKIYFFSRDGFVMKQAFDLINKEKHIRTFYLEVSRRSLRVPILWKNYSLENIFTMVSPSMLVSLNSIFDAVGLCINEYTTLLKKYGYDVSTSFHRNEILSDKCLAAMYEELSASIEKNSLEEYENLQMYIRQNDIGGRFAVVDIGWSGGMQRFLQTTLKEMQIDAEIFGYYTGIADYFKRNTECGQMLNLHGYLFDFSHNPNDTDYRSCFVGLYEMLFLETKGSVKKYIKDDTGHICVERYDYEYVIDGQILNEVNLIKEVQQGALDYIVDNVNLNIHNIDKVAFCKKLLDAGQKPTNEAIYLFADFRFFDEGECYPLAAPRSLLYYFFNIKDFKQDFLKSRWKTAFLKRIFKIPFPYYFIYNVLKKLSTGSYK